VAHSVIIGISLGASQNTKTIKPLLVALSFHQFFEGLGLGGCISQVYLSPPVYRLPNYSKKKFKIKYLYFFFILHYSLFIII
jgi:hypothetical protein